MPVAEGTVIVSGNRIAVEVKRLLPKSPDIR
jgi:flagellar motor switch protein FliN/FliY